MDWPPRAKRLRDLCVAAEPPLEPYEGLWRRVGELSAQHERSVLSCRSGWHALQFRWGPAVV